MHTIFNAEEIFSITLLKQTAQVNPHDYAKVLFIQSEADTLIIQTLKHKHRQPSGLSITVQC